MLCWVFYFVFFSIHAIINYSLLVIENDRIDFQLKAVEVGVQRGGKDADQGKKRYRSQRTDGYLGWIQVSKA